MVLLIAKMVSELEIRTAITGMVIGGHQTRNGSFDYEDAN